MAFQFIDLNSSLVVAVNCDNQRVKAKNETQRGLKKKKQMIIFLERNNYKMEIKFVINKELEHM